VSREGIVRSVAHRLAGTGSPFADEGALPPFDRATGWLNSPPLTPAALRGRVVLVSFWTYTCVNWLRTLPYLRAWDATYRRAGLTVVGVHTPEFGFEGDPDNVERRTRALEIAFPVALDTGYGVWNDFANRYWPAVYLADAAGRLRYHHFGEGEYAMTEMAIQQLLAEAGAPDIGTGLVAVDPAGLEVAADWSSLRSPETYLGYARSSGFASEDPALYDVPHTYAGRGRLARNTWDLSGDWTVGRDASTLHRAGGRLRFAFHARDLNLVAAPGGAAAAVPFRVWLDGEPVATARGSDVDAGGGGLVAGADTYQLVRQPGEVADRVAEIEFLESGVEVYCVTFG